MPGRKPKPTAIKELHGNPGKRRLNKSEPRFSGLPVCPAWLPSPAKTEWKRIVTQLEELNMLKSTDQAALAAYCVSYARWLSAERIVNREGQTVREPVTDKTGAVVGHKTKRHPATIIARDERSSMLKAAALFGFDPSSRSRVQLPEQEVKPEHDLIDSNLFAAEDSSGIVH
jgi:P27 family predicted phage terminase small subunit